MNKNSTKILSLKPEDREEEEEKKTREKAKQTKDSAVRSIGHQKRKREKIQSIILIVHVVVGIVVDLLTYKVPDVEN
jgi:hypothetical protein